MAILSDIDLGLSFDNVNTKSRSLRGIYFFTVLLNFSAINNF